jgi:WD40 repeat protein
MKKILFLIALSLLLISEALFAGGMEDIVWQKEYWYLYSMDFSKDSKYLAVFRTTPDQVNIFDVSSSEIIKTLENEKNPKFTNDGKYLITAQSNKISIWTVEKWEFVKSIPMPYTIGNYDLSTDNSTMIVTAGEN